MHQILVILLVKTDAKYLQQIVKKAAGQYVLDAYSSSPQRIKKEEELANSSTDVE